MLWDCPPWNFGVFFCEPWWSYVLNPIRKTIQTLEWFMKISIRDTSRYPTTHVFSYHYHCRLSWLILSRLEKTTWRETFIGPSCVTNPKLGISTGKWCVCHQNISKLPFITVTSDVRWALRGGTICCTFDACHIYIYSQSNIHPCIQTKFQVNISF